MTRRHKKSNQMIKKLNQLAMSRGKINAYSLLCYIGIIALIASCVPAKKLAYLQPAEGLEAEHAYDSITSTYNRTAEKYRLKPEDVISLRVASITEEEYNFIKGYETDLGIIRELNQYDNANMQGGAGGGNQMMQGGGMQNQGDQPGGLATIMLDRLNTGFKLDGQGALELPKIGNVILSGLTVTEAEAKVKKALEGFYETPMVRIQLLNYHFTILGEVEKEGRYISYNPDLNIFDGITLAGNLTEFADRSNIKIVRQEGGDSKVFYLNLLDERTLSAEHFQLKRGDLIVVPPLNARTATMYTLPNAARALGIVSAALSLAALIITLGR